MSVPPATTENAAPPSLTTSSDSSVLTTSSGGADELKSSLPGPPPLDLHSLIAEHNLFLSQIESQNQLDFARMDSVIASARGTRPNNSAQSPPQPRRELETSKRLLQDAKMTRLVSRLIAAKDQAVEKDEGEREQRAREMQQIRELRDVIAGFKEWDRTVLEGRMRELELELALEEMDMRGEE